MNKLLANIFDVNSFNAERRFLRCTLLMFAMSYCIVVARCITIYVLISIEGESVKVWICENNFYVNLINTSSWLLIDLLPLGTIFYLHWLNFRKESLKDFIRDKMHFGGDVHGGSEGSSTASPTDAYRVR